MYTAAGKPVRLDLYERPILFISVGCGECDKVLADLVSVSDKPLIVDTLIQGPLEEEITAMQNKLTPFGLSAENVLYDLHNEAPVSGVPTITGY